MTLIVYAVPIRSMGTMANGRFIYGTQATGTHVKTNVSGSALIGFEQSQRVYADCDIAYSFRVESDASGDNIILALDTGIAVATVGVPTIIEGDGRDFEGVILPAALNILAVMIVCKDSQSSVMTVTGTEVIIDAELKQTDQVLSMAYDTGVTATGQTMSIIFGAASQAVEVVVIAKST